MQITIENICQICERKGCKEPCKKYYSLIEGKSIPLSAFGFVDDEKEKNDDKN